MLIPQQKVVNFLQVTRKYEGPRDPKSSSLKIQPTSSRLKVRNGTQDVNFPHGAEFRFFPIASDWEVLANGKASRDKGNPVLGWLRIREKPTSNGRDLKEGLCKTKTRKSGASRGPSICLSSLQNNKNLVVIDSHQNQQGKMQNILKQMEGSGPRKRPPKRARSCPQARHESRLLR